MSAPMLAARLDGRVVVLNPQSAQVVLMDAQAERVWRSCRGLTEKEIAAQLGEAPSSVETTLQDLVAVGLVTHEQGRWTPADVSWV